MIAVMGEIEMGELGDIPSPENDDIRHGIVLTFLGG